MRHVASRPRLSLPMPQRVRDAMAEADYDSAGLLDGLDHEARRTRVTVLLSLARDGVGVETMREAIDEGRLGLLLLERSLRPDDGQSMDDICVATALEPAVVRQWFQALGRPIAPDASEKIYTDEDVDVARRITEYRNLGFTDDELFPVVRAVGRGVLNIADALAGLLGDALVSDGEPDPETALRYAEETRRIAETDSLHLVHLVSVALAERIRSHALAATDTNAGRLRGAQEVTVCFADLVGFTDLGESISADELSEVAERLSAAATDVVSRPVRLAKTIGDAIMLVSPDTVALVASTVELVRTWSNADDGRPALKVGIARGIGVPHAGDWFGTPVNLASRITQTARPGYVTVTAEVHEALVAAGPVVAPYRYRAASPRKFKGIRGPQRLYRVSPIPDEVAAP